MTDEYKIKDSPYKGLTPYFEEDAEFFFGRTTERDNIIFNLMGARLTLLYGPTGVGKSSVLRAGVAYKLNRLAKENLENYGAPEFVAVVFKDWQGDPLRNLCESVHKAVAGILGNGTAADEWPTTGDLCGTLKAESRLIDGDLLIILDQFEEFFLYHSQDGGESNFTREFARAVNDMRLPVSFLISIRADALATLDVFKGKIPDLFSNYLRIQYLSTQAAQEAIRKPLDVFNKLKAGLEDERSRALPEFTIEDELVDEVCRQVQAGTVLIGETGYAAVDAKDNKDQVETSFLQLVMTKLWEAEFNKGSHRLRLATLKHLGNAGNIVKTHLNNQLQVLPAQEQEIAAALFRYLVTPGGTKIAFSVSDLVGLTVSDLAGSEEERKESISRVLEKLSPTDVRILRPFFRDNREQSEKNYEIFHDVLAPAILEWRAQYLAEKEKAQVARETKEREEQERARIAEEAMRLAEEVQRKVEAEERRRKREERRVRQLMFILGGSVIITVLFFFLFFYALSQADKALKASEEAEKAKQEITAEKAEAGRRLEIINALDQSVPYFKAVMRGHEQSVVGVNFSPDGNKIVTASADGTARVWNASTGERVSLLRDPEGKVNSAAFGPKDDRLIVTTSGRTARIWSIYPPATLHVLAGHKGDVTGAQFSPDGRLVVTSSDDETARVWEVETGRQVFELKGHRGAITSATFSPNSNFVVTSSIDGTARVWDAVTGSQTALLEGHKNAVNTAAFSPKGDLVVTASSDHEAQIWEVASGQSVAVLKGHTASVNSAEFSPDGTLIVTSSNDRTARVWDVKSHSTVRTLSGHKAEVVSAQFSRDNVRVITASADKTALVWEAVSGKILFELRGHTNVVNYAVFSPNGETAATASEDTTARTWDVSGAGGIRVTDLSFRIEPDKYNGVCPAGLRFIGTITVMGSGTVKYRFVRRNVTGGVGPERTIEFFNSGSKDVSTTRLLGGPKYPTPSGSVYLEIISPEAKHSDDARYSIKCQFPSGPTNTGPKSILETLQPADKPTPTPTPPRRPEPNH
ncbi:MAG TPA: hypothetical protein VGP08_21890 [Pyrinomonadaceae bacterium]|jgi:WD40 repeat protein|nr:hypothetical protein [Pyrinomonadaceae bacterium]